MHELFSAFISGYGNVKNIVIGQELTTIDVFFRSTLYTNTRAEHTTEM